MAIQVSRDFPANNVGANYIANSALYQSYLYTTAIYLHKILGYSIVGQTGFDLNNTNSQTFTAFANTSAITAASNGQTLPQATINVTTTTGFPASGTIYVGTNAGVQIVRYSGTTATTFTNCTGGTGTMTSSSSTTIAVASNGAILPQATINVEATATASTTIAVASNGVSLPTGTINVASTTGFPTAGTLNVTTGAGVQTVTYTGKTATTFTGCAGGTGTMSTGGAVNNTGFFINFATSGTIYVMTTAGPQIVNYTGRTATTFTGCTGGTGTMTTGNTVTTTGGAVACGQNKILTATGAPWLLTTTFPHGMTTGEYAQVFPAAVINTGAGFTPYPVEVVSPTQLKLSTSAGGSGYTANSQSLAPPGMLIASGSVGAGTGASINFGGAPSVYAVQIPPSIRTVVNGTAPTAGDTGRLLVLKSSSYPTKNTGIYKITATNTATNSYTIDYRSTDTPPPESGTLDWWIYETEFQISNYLLWGDYNRFTYGLLSPGASNTSPIQITYNINVVQYFKTGQRVIVSGVNGNTAANGTWTITVNGANTLLLDGSAGNGTYTSGGTIQRATSYVTGSDNSVASRILLQSPHPTGWQVRLCVEMYNTPLTSNYCSVCIGYNGSVNGDFQIGGTTSLVVQYLDILPAGSSPYRYTVTGSAKESVAPRISMVGDEAGRFVFVYTRTQGAGSNGLLMFGLPDNEPTPLPPTINRPFIYSGVTGSALDYGGIQMRTSISNNAGFTFRDVGPEMCAIAGFANADGVSGTSPVYSANAGDCPFTGTTEVVPWEVWGGVLTDPALVLPFPSEGNTIYTINQRFMGTVPYLRQGRTNFGTFTLSTDSTTAFSVSTTSGNLVSPIQVTTTAPNALTTGQTVTISGVLGNTAANGTFVITVIDSTNFTLSGTTGNGAYAGGGTGNGSARWIHLQNGIYMQWNGASGLTP